MALMQITIIPLGTKTPSVGRYVAGVQRLLQEKKANFILNDMGTEIYGEASELLSLASEIHEFPFQQGAQRVVTQIVLDDRRDIERGIGEKRQAVLDRLERKE